MPFDAGQAGQVGGGFNPATAAAIAGGSNLVESGVNALIQSSQNRKERQWQEMMYGKQRADALSDWNMQNTYNSPVEQMKRLKAAGLNPNLVYGTGVAGATGQSGQPRSSSPGNWHPTAPQVSIGSPVMSALDTFFNMQLKQAQVENLHRNNELMQSAIYKNYGQGDQSYANIPFIGSKKNLTDQMFGYRSEANPLALEQANLQNTRLQVLTDVDIQRNEREAAMNSANLAIAGQKIINMRMDVLRQKMENEVDVQKIQNMKGQLAFLGVQAANLSSATDLNNSELKARTDNMSWHDGWLNRFMSNVSNSLWNMGSNSPKVPNSPPPGSKFKMDDSSYKIYFQH